MSRAYRLNDPMYLGDGAYAKWDGLALTLYTFDGIEEQNRVVLEPSAIIALLALFRSIQASEESTLLELVLRHLRD